AFGGNDLAAAAALATLRILDSEGLVARAERLGALLMELTAPLAERYEVVREVRGLGLMWAIELVPPGGGPSARATGANGAGAGPRDGGDTPRRARRASLWGAVERAQPGLFSQTLTVPLFHRHRIFCQVAGHRMNVIKALPALVIEEDEIRRFAAALEEVVAAAERSPAALALTRFGLGVARRRVAGALT
ncbi:MAG: aminotransferase class III-fold pyridoxal phosphate-dependent enzyme, partial [Acidobacteriota bacterium]|nr:aminotransferase class III-fold pyridoxal phosphate-dependent enzyme [Acidobacteriota bacterium]